MLTHNAEKLNKLMRENPELPVVIIVAGGDCDDPYENYGMMRMECDIGEVLDCRVEWSNDMLLYSDRKHFNEILTEHLKYEGFSGNKLKARLKTEIEEYKPYWKKAIRIWCS